MTKSVSWICCAAVLFALIVEGYLETIPLCFNPVKLAYVVEEPIGGANETLAPVIFLHGASTSKEYWFDTPQYVADKTKRRVFNLDARNHGDSEWSDIYNYDMNAQDLVHFLDSKSIEKAILVGHSMGGITAIKVALAHPERVEMVFVEDMYTKRLPRETQANVIEFLELIEGAVARIPTDLNQTDANQFVLKQLVGKEAVVKALTEEAVNRIPTDLNQTAANQFVLKQIVGKEAVVKALGEGARRTSNKRLIAMKRGDDGRYAMKANMKAIINSLRTEEATMSENRGHFEGKAYFMFGMGSAFKVWDELKHIRRFFLNAIFIPMDEVNHEIHLSVPEEFKNALVNVINKQA